MIRQSGEKAAGDSLRGAAAYLTSGWRSAASFRSAGLVLRSARPLACCGSLLPGLASCPARLLPASPAVGAVPGCTGCGLPPSVRSSGLRYRAIGPWASCIAAVLGGLALSCRSAFGRFGGLSAICGTALARAAGRWPLDWSATISPGRNVAQRNEALDGLLGAVRYTH